MVKKKYSLKEVHWFAKDYIQYLKKEHRLPIKQAYLYGSYAKGRPRDWSDVDIAVISPKFKKNDSFTYLGLWRRNDDIMRQISPIGFHPHNFKPKEDSLAHEIAEHGIRIC